ncbi:MAG: hypothetical protein ACJ79H_05725 [Myxococcales bacterium]
MAALMMLVAVLAIQSRTRDIRGHSSAQPAAASSGSSLRLAASASSRPPADHPPPRPSGGAPLPRSEPVTEDVPQVPARPAANVVPPSDEQLAALQQLVAQSREENDRLARIDEHLALARWQAADEELRREDEAEAEAAQHAATVQALWTLRQADALLSTGESDGVDDELSRAEAALFGPTRIDVDAAREALERSDLHAARQYLAAALAERRSPR